MKSKQPSLQRQAKLRTRLLVILLLGVFSLFLLMPFAPKIVELAGNKHQPATQHEPTNSENLVPVFKKEGELSFIKAATGKKVSTIDIEIATTFEERQQGLMFRRQMPSHQGMLFVFNESEPQAFWMKDTYIPLDIIYVDEKRTIVSIVANAQPLSETSLPSGVPAQYVVEVVAGFCAGNNIVTGDKIEF